MSLRIRPVRRDYDPGYPAMIEVDDWRGLLARSSRAVFDPRTLAFAGLLGTSLFVPAPAAAAPVPSKLTAENARAAEIANAALAEVKGQAMWKGSASLSTKGYVEGNPDITVPKIPISFGNSRLGVFDFERARKVTADIFRAYGLDPQMGHQLKREGFEFKVDGYDPKAGVGFEIVGSENPPRGFGRAAPPRPEVSERHRLDPEEAKRVMSAVRSGELKLLMVPVDRYPNMDNDQYTPLAAYLRSVLDYLDWLKANGRL